MGSGLILLVIVAAWLAVLVPMALRSHDSNTSLSSVDRFSDAMRVLSRRDAAARARAREVAGPERLGVDEDEDDLYGEGYDDVYGDLGPGRGAQLLERVRPVMASARDQLVAGSPAARRRRLLIGLVVLALVTLVGGIVGPRVLLVVQVLVDVALGLFVLQLRRLAVRRAQSTRPRRPVRRPVPSNVRARSGSVRVERPAPPVDDLVEVPFAEPVVVGEPLVVEPARAEQPLFDQAAFADEPAAEPAAVAQEPAVEDAPVESLGLGAPWTPVPVPAPIYANAPVAPSRRSAPEPARTSEWTEPPAADGPEQGEVRQRRRAVNEW